MVEKRKGVTNRNFPKKLSKLMKRKNISVDDLAEKMNENPVYIYLLSKGKRCSIQLITLISFAKALRVPLAYFRDCIRDDIIDENIGVTNKKFTYLLVNKMKEKRISHMKLAYLMNWTDEIAAEYVLGIRYKVDIPTLLKLVDVLKVSNEYFWSCIEL